MASELSWPFSNDDRLFAELIKSADSTVYDQSCGFDPSSHGALYLLMSSVENQILLPTLAS